jgi:hypothetical protein
VQVADGLVGAIERQRIGTRERERAQVVNPMHVVGMEVRVEHRVHAADACRKQLQAEFRWGVHEQANAVVFDERGGAGAAIPGIIGATGGAVATDLRDPHGGPRPEESEAHLLKVSRP